MKLGEFILGKDFVFSSSAVMDSSSSLCCNTLEVQNYMLKQYHIVYSDSWELSVYYKPQTSVENLLGLKILRKKIVFSLWYFD